MRQTKQTAELKGSGLAVAGLVESGMEPSGRKRVETMVETLANLRGTGESLAEVAHDARNMVTALGLYCDLLEEPGVLNPSFHHYAGELRLVATASRRLVEKLMALDLRLGPDAMPARSASPAEDEAAGAVRRERSHFWELVPAGPIGNLAGELLASRNLLSALAGAAIALTMDVEGGALPVRLTGEDLTRVLVNLVKNAAEAMPGGGRISIGLHEFHSGTKTPPWLMLTVDDNGPGIPAEALEKIFDSGYTTRASGASTRGGWPAAAHRGLGLSITRSIIEAAGGSIHAANRTPAGTRIQIELPACSR